MGAQVDEYVAAVQARHVEQDFVELLAAGASVAGEFRCADCGYGVVVHRVLPQCPMCGGAAWESRTLAPARLAG